MKTFVRLLSIAAFIVIPNTYLAAMPIGWGEQPAWVQQWSSAAEVQLSYYNYCTGWVWVWGGWEAGDRAGVVFDSGCQPGEVTTLVDSRVYCWEGAPPDYGFTGSISVHDVDVDGCPVDPPLDSKAWLPADGNNEFVWNTLVGERFAIVATFANDSLDYHPAWLVTDHPAEVRWSAPAACGLCYPTTRVNHSFFYHRSYACSAFNTGVVSCDAQLLFDAGVNYAVGVSDRTWGQIKALYR